MPQDENLTAGFEPIPKKTAPAAAPAGAGDELDLSSGFEETPIPLKEATAVRPSPETSFLPTLGRELKGFAGAFDPRQIAGLLRNVSTAFADPVMAGFPAARETAPLAQAAAQEAPKFKADPWAYMLSKAPEAIGQAAGTVVAGKALTDLPGAVQKVGEFREGTGMARLTERLPANIEGEPAANVVKRTFGRLGLSGREPLEQVQQAVQAESKQITAEENAILDQRVGGTPIRQAPADAAARSVAQRLRATIDPRTPGGANIAEFDPELRTAVDKLAQTYEKPGWTAERLQDRKDTLNKRLTAFYSQPDFKAALQANDPRIGVLEDETKAVRDAYYDQLSQLSGRDLRAMKKTQSDFIELQKALVSPVGREAQRAAAARAHPILGPKGSWQRKALVGGPAALGIEEIYRRWLRGS